MRNQNYRQNGSRHQERLATFREQMADYARGQFLRELREKRHLSQEDAAHELAVSVKSVRSWEKGGKIRWFNAQKAGEFYGIDPERLVSREEGGTPALAVLRGEGKADDDYSTQLDRIEENQQNLAVILEELGQQVEAIRVLCDSNFEELRRAPGRQKRQAG